MPSFGFNCNLQCFFFLKLSYVNLQDAELHDQRVNSQGCILSGKRACLLNQLLVTILEFLGKSDGSLVSVMNV